MDSSSEDEEDMSSLKLLLSKRGVRASKKGVDGSQHPPILPPPPPSSDSTTLTLSLPKKRKNEGQGGDKEREKKQKQQEQSRAKGGVCASFIESGESRGLAEVHRAQSS